MKNKFIFVFVLLLLCSLSLFGCDTPDNSTDAEQPPINDGEQTQQEINYEMSMYNDTLELEVGEEKTLVAILLANGKTCNDEITWSSNAESVATVNAGKVKAIAEGTAVITASAHNVSATATITVVNSEVSLVLSANYVEVAKGATLQLDAWLTNGEIQNLTYTSSDNSIATISQTGLITAVEEGEITITVSVDNLTKTCKVKVTPNYELIFPEIVNKDVFVGDTIDLGVLLKINGLESDEPIEIIGEGFTVDGDVITIIDDGKITITVKYEDAEISQKITSWTKITTVAEFLAIDSNLDGYFKLMNDLDFEGAQVKAFTSWNTWNANNDDVFKGVFDGQNYSIMNLQPIPESGNDASIFGYMIQGSVVKNVNFIGVIGEGRFSVVSSWCHGLIENVYVEMEYISTSASSANASNPTGALVIKAQRDSVIRNCVVNLSLVDGADTTHFGGLVGLATFNTLISNCYVLCEESLPLAHAGVEYVKSSSRLFDSLTDLNYVMEADETYGSNWTVVQGQYPHLGTVDSTISVEKDNLDVFAGRNTQLSASSKFELTYSLVQAIDGVTLSKDGLLTVSNSVADATNITVLVTNNYGGQATINITVNTATLDVVGGEDIVIDDYILGASSSNYTYELIIKKNNEEVTEGITYVSSNESVATVDGKVINIKGVAGTTKISVLYNGVEIHSFDFTVTAIYHPITTKEEFLAIGTSQETMSFAYKLMNDIDFNGVEVASFASKNNNELYFSGIFDGQGHSLMNFKLVKPNDNTNFDVGLFGSIRSNGVVKNLNVIGAQMPAVGGVIASYIQDGGIVENCFVDVTVTSMSFKLNGSQQDLTASVNGGAFAWRINDAKSKLVNCISVVRIAVTNSSDVAKLETWYGGFVGANYGTIENCQSIVLSNHTLKEFTSAAASATKMTDSKVYNSISAFYAEVDLSKYDDIWTFDENAQVLPHLGIVASTITVEDSEVYVGASSHLSAVSHFELTYSLVEAIDGVTLSKDGVLTVADFVVADTLIEVLVENAYGGQNTFIVTVKALTLDVESIESVTIADCIIGDANSIIAHEISVSQNGTLITSGITYASTNEKVAVVDSTNITLKGAGSASIQVLYNGVEIHSFIVTVGNVWYPVRTTEEFLAAKADGSKNYKLMNDIDFNDSEIEAGHKEVYFAGIFDGQGYTLKNFTLVKTSIPYNNAIPVDVSLFGGLDGKVINLNITGAKMPSIGGVIAGYVRNGSIENCFVEVTITSMTLKADGSQQNMQTNVNGGAFAYRLNSANAKLVNCISVITIEVTDSANVGILETWYGAFVGRNAGTIDNCQAIVLSGHTLKPSTSTSSNNAPNDNSTIYSSINEFYESVSESSYPGWIFDSNKIELPYVGNGN